MGWVDISLGVGKVNEKFESMVFSSGPFMSACSALLLNIFFKPTLIAVHRDRLQHGAKLSPPQRRFFAAKSQKEKTVQLLESDSFLNQNLQDYLLSLSATFSPDTLCDQMILSEAKAFAREVER